MKMAKINRFLEAYKRAIVWLFDFAFCAYILIYPGEFVRDHGLLIGVFVTLIASQIFWIRRALDLGERFLPGKPRRGVLAVVATLVYLFFFIYSFGPLTSRLDIPRAADMAECSHA